MSRSPFQRLALVTIVVLLATIASNRLSAYASGHHDAVLASVHRVVTIHAQDAREVCRVRAEAHHRAEVERAVAEAHREMARVQRELAREQRLHAEEARQMAHELQRELQQELRRELHVVVN